VVCGNKKWPKRRVWCLVSFGLQVSSIAFYIYWLMISIIFRFYLWESMRRVKVGCGNKKWPKQRRLGSRLIFLFYIVFFIYWLTISIIFRFYLCLESTQYLPHLDPLSLREMVEWLFYNGDVKMGPKNGTRLGELFLNKFFVFFWLISIFLFLF